MHYVVYIVRNDMVHTQHYGEERREEVSSIGQDQLCRQIFASARRGARGGEGLG